MRPSVRLSAKPINSTTGDGYNQEWTIKLPGGVVYHSLQFFTTLKHVATIGRISVDINGTNICYTENKILDLLDTIHDEHSAEGVFTWDFSKFTHQSIAGQTMRELATYANEEVILRIEVKSKGTNDPAVPNIELEAYISDMTADAPRVIVPRQYEHTMHVPASGKFPFQFPAARRTLAVQSLLFDESSVQINEIIVKLGDNIVDRWKRAQLEYALQRFKKLNLPAGYCYLNFLLVDLVKSESRATVSGNRALNFELDVTGTGALKFYVVGQELVA